MARALIAGCGYVGSALGTRLAEEGHEVFGLRRNVDRLPPTIRPIAASLSESSTLRAHAMAFDWLFFTAGPDESTEAAYRLTYLQGLSSLLAVFGRDARRVLFTSSTAVYAQAGGEWVDEASETEPEHFSGRVLLEAEARLLELRPDATVLRLGGIYGPGRASLVEAVRRGDATYDSSDESWVNRMHRDDCALALAHLAGLEQPESLYLGVDDEPASRRQVLEFIAGELGSPAPRPATPGTRPRRRPASNKRCRNARLRASGYDLAFPSYRQGYRSIIAG